MPCTESRDALLCAAAALLVIAITVPFAECGVNDDWSFTKTALDLAQTGRLQYNGWATPIVGAQAYWGALFIKLFGFSFFATRASTMVLAPACAALVYGLHRRSNLPGSYSRLGAMTLISSPLFVPNAASFMTEVPALVLFLGCIYSYVRLIDTITTATRRGARGRWLAAATATGILAGTVRQTCWIAPLLVPCYIAWRFKLWRRDRHLLAYLLSSSILACGVAALILHWFNEQPYAVHDQVEVGLQALARSETPLFLASQLNKLVLTLAAVSLPVLAIAPFSLWQLSGRQKVLVLLTATALVIAELCAAPNVTAFPWLPNTFTITPYANGTTLMPPTAVTLNLPWSFWGNFAAAVLCLASVAVSAAALYAFDSSVRKPLARIPLSPVTAPLELLSVFAAGYLPLLLLKSLVPGSAGIFDRYLLFVMPLATISGLLLYRQLGNGRLVPAVSWLLLGAVGFYAIAQTHDNFAHVRARTAAAHALSRLVAFRAPGLWAAGNTTAGRKSQPLVTTTTSELRSQDWISQHRRLCRSRRTTVFEGKRPWSSRTISSVMHPIRS